MKKPFLISVLLLCLAGSAQEAPDGDVTTHSHQVALRHPGTTSNTPKLYSLYQVKDAKGFPIGYRMVVDSVICLEKTCEVIDVTLFWDALGGYQGYELEKGKVLEKARVLRKSKVLLDKETAYEAVPFTNADYKKLDRILRDDQSVLRTLKLRDMSVSAGKAKVDAVSGATPTALKKAVVEGASLTCYQLWHWANGEIVETERELTHLSCSEELLHHFLLSDKPRFVLFALEHLKGHKLSSPSLIKAVNKVMRSDDLDWIKPCLSYLKRAMPETQYYDNLAAMFDESNSKCRVHLLGILEPEKELPGRLFDEMSVAFPSMSTYYELHLLLRLVRKHEHVSQRILTQLVPLLESENFFIARKTFWYLEDQTVDEQIKKQMQAFRDKCIKAGRGLD
ncbi:MAG: hypothetical protein GY878_14200 [Fuerstiella sp.]|nr:hypothetical protein [Fuerstiella sp.]